MKGDMPIHPVFQACVGGGVKPFPGDVLEHFRARALINHGQSLERLRERGGMSPCELLALVEDRPIVVMDDVLALEKLGEFLRSWKAPDD